jgi:hypothetical protein
MEDTGGVYYIVGSGFAPRDVRGVLFGEEGYPLSVDGDGAVVVCDLAAEASVDGVVLQHVSHIIRRHKGVVDADKVKAGVIETRAENQTTDPAESVDTDLNAHYLAS